MRALRIILIIGLVLAGLFVAVDRWAAGYAEDELAARVQIGRGLAGSTEVDIHGFPFLTQALGHELEQVDVRLKGVEASADGRRLRITQLDARFHDVAVKSDYSGGTAAAVDGTALVSYEDLTKASQTGVTLTYGGAPGKVKVTATVEILGRSITRSVVSTISLVDGTTVRVRADEVPGEGIPGVEGMVRRKTDFDRRIDGLPKGIELSGLTSDAGGVHLTIGGKDVVLAGS
ncbi:LmeA family phospholipid-binding protein [Streptomyces antimicrobicus]|uniref:DUF2993 domain-containing protein n=1 Tax=Streptomyces antimicrobicus TaxID=2883108 RepID=A0ABS8B2S5_9ACTN|nr:DUF2993 domain-containing protein [Streptomyces antimicrobicus]MCB5178913.1 DUF2993 domain-containing protein [Streptomyces antimicrobicus]